MKQKKTTRKKTHTTKNTETNKTVKGILEITRSGMGYVLMPAKTGDVIVRPNHFSNALNGDEVEVKITKENLETNRKEGKIIGVLKRKQTEFIGELQHNKTFAFVNLMGNKNTSSFFIPLDQINNAKNGDKVVIKLLKWDAHDKSPVATVIKVLDGESINNLAMREILLDGGFSLEFDENIIKETNALPSELEQEEIAKRVDYRNTLTFTIDPIDAKDFDDAISIKPINDDLFEIGVHIADVSHYVKPNTALDEEAYKRATSVYLPDRVNPMLPEKISNELCSLRPHEDKFTFTAVFEITRNAVVKKVNFHKSVIHSNHRFSYEDAQEIIEDKVQETNDGVQYSKEILLLNEIAKKFRSKRFEAGAINFSSQEVRFKLDENAKPIGIIVKESKEAHQLIEEFMLLANKAVAEFVNKAKYKGEPIPFPYRIHDTPDEEKLSPFIAFAKKYGHVFDISTPEAIAKSFNELLQTVKGKPEQQVFETLGIRTMAKATYTINNIGHYGLGFKHYCHFTSPIRRYPDVLVHRVLQGILTNQIVIDKKLEEKCVQSSKMERAAMDCERAANKYKQVEFMQEKLGQMFDAVISGVSSFGFWAETVEHKCEGLVSIAHLSEKDDFRLVEGDYCLVGKRSGKKYKMGDKVKILLVAANLDKRQLDYELV
jgi:ribonuclease R